MARTDFFRKIQQLMRVAAHCERTNEPAADALQRLREQARQQPRRQLLGAVAGLGLASSLPMPLRAAPGAGGKDVAVVGAGFAGLYAATLLAGKGARPQVFEAGDRVGGRVWSLRGFFPGQVAERGAE